MNFSSIPLRAAEIAADALAVEARRQRVLRMIAADVHLSLPADKMDLIFLALRLNDEAHSLCWRVLAVNFDAANDLRAA